MSAFLNPQEILKAEPPEALEKLEAAVDVCLSFRTAFAKYKTWYGILLVVSLVLFNYLDV